MSIKIVLADDHTLFQHGLRKAFEDEPDVELVGLAKDGYEAVELVRELSPDLVLMDVSMPKLNGVEATRVIARDYPEVKVIGLSTHSSNTYVRQMFLAGASGYLLKDCSFEELVEAIKKVVNGEDYISSGIDSSTIKQFLQNR